jgi:hypothetical protein
MGQRLGMVAALRARSVIASRATVMVAFLMLVAAPASATVILGNTEIGVVDDGDSNYLNGSSVTVGSTSLVVTSMSVFVGSTDTSPNNRYQVAIYTDINGAPGALVVASATGTLSPHAWNALPVSAVLQANTSYWLVYNTNGRAGSLNNMYYSAGNPGRGVYSSMPVAFGSWPATFGAATLTTAAYALYATAESNSDPTPPSVAITAPGQGATVFGTVIVSADASDNVGVAGVQFSVDSLDLGAQVTAAPYAVGWDTATTANGPHTLTAVARDTAGNLTTSAPVTVTVLNSPAIVGQWSPLMTWPLVAIHATLLKNGKVLVWDEQDSVTQPKLWDPGTLAFTDTPLVGSELFCAGHTQLADGRVLVAGGHHPQAGEVGTNVTYQYLPDTNSWVRTGDMFYDRWYPAITKLGDGRVAIFSGQITTGLFADTPELYDPATGLLTLLSTIATPELKEEEYPANFYLPGGKVLAISPEHGPVQLFDAGATTWTRVTTTPIRFGSAVQYRPGRILMSGGGAAFYATADGQAAVLDMAVPTPAWRPTSSMAVGRYMHNLVMLPTGEVLALGGCSTVDEQTASGPLTTELWSPDTETWTTLAPLAVPRMYHSTALLLPDGRVLAAGGGHNGPAPNQFSAQVYSPPYLFRGPRPSITSAPEVVVYGAPPFVVNSPDAPDIASVSLIALGSATHSNDMNQFYAELAFTKTAGQLVIAVPGSSDEAPPGYYMLFLVDSDGVPSVATIVRLTTSASGPPLSTTSSTSTSSTSTSTSSTSTSSSLPTPPPPSTTLGLTAIGAIEDSQDSNFLTGSRVFTSNGGVIVSMSVYVGAIDSTNSSRRYQMALYTDNGGRPGTRVAATATGTLAANAWNTLPIAATVQPNSSYWLMYNTSGRTSAVNNMRYNVGSVGQGAYSANRVSFGKWPTTFPAPVLSNAIYSLYATLGP